MISHNNITQLHHSFYTMSITLDKVCLFYRNSLKKEYTRTDPELLTFDEWKTAMAAAGNPVHNRFFYLSAVFDLSIDSFIALLIKTKMNLLRNTEYDYDDLKTIRICKTNRNISCRIYIELKNDDVIEFPLNLSNYVTHETHGTGIYCVQQVPGCFLPLKLRMFKKEL